MPKQFLSFLGTSNYLNCNYILGDEKVTNVKYIQQALVELLCNDWTEKDKITIFVTKESKEKHWIPNEENGNGENPKNIGLKHQLLNLNLKCQIEEILVPSGQNEEELWEIFEHIYDAIGKENELIIDITHAFRSLPMLLIIVINYAKLLKNISVSGIFYGAFETLGRINEIKTMPIEERNAPIFDLLPFERLLNWTSATHNILNYGDFSDLNRLSSSKRDYGLEQSSFDEELTKEKTLLYKLNNFADIFRTCRGYDIIEKHDFTALKKRIRKVTKKERKVRLLNHLLELIYSKLQIFENKSIENGYKAVSWCIEHNLVQQAYTILQENMISEILIKYYDENLLTDYITRVKTKLAFSQEIRTDIEKFKKEKMASFSESDIKEIISLNKLIPEQYFTIYEKLTLFRNDINHAGMNKNPIKSRNIINEIKTLYNDLNQCRKQQSN